MLGERHNVLGEDAMLGRSVFSVQDKIRIRIFTKDLAQYIRFLPTGDLCEPLADLVFFYNGEQLDWDAELAIPSGAAEPIRIGKLRPARLDDLDGAELDVHGSLPARCAVSSRRAHEAQARCSAKRRDKGTEGGSDGRYQP